MIKNTTANKRTSTQAIGNKKQSKASNQRLTIGLDLGDLTTRYCILDEAGEVVSEDRIPTARTGFSSLLEKMAPSRVALEVGTHSPWVSRHIEQMGHEVIVANPHKVKLITQSSRKNDQIDAQKLARLARVDPKLLSPIRHRGEQAQWDLAVIRARAELIKTRTAIVNSARGLAKPMGERLKKCDADQVKQSMSKGLSENLQRILGPLLKCIEEITEQIAEYDRRIEEIGKRYPEAELLLQQVYGVGTVISLSFLLTIEDPHRFAHSRDVGAYLGLQPRQRDSGDSQPQLGISKTGDAMVRSLLVQGAHCILRKGAPDSDLRAWGLSKMKSGGPRAKKRAIVAVARKLAVLLHRLWVSGEVYDPLYNRKAVQAAKRQAKTEAA